MCGSKPVCDTVGLLQQGVVVVIIIVDLQPPERPRPWLAACAQRPEQNWGGEKRKQIIACSSNGKAEKMLRGFHRVQIWVPPFFPPTSTQYNKKTRYSYSPVIVVSTSRTPTTRPITRGRSTQASAANRHRAWVRVPLLGCADTDSKRHMSA